MKRLNSEYVRISNNNLDNTDHNMAVDQCEKYSKSVIDQFYKNDKLICDEKPIIISSISIEMRRLFIRCLRSAKYSNCTEILDSKIVSDVFSTIELCISHIVYNNRDKDNCYRSAMILNIGTLFDIYNIDILNTESANLIAFINHFINKLTYTAK